MQCDGAERVAELFGIDLRYACRELPGRAASIGMRIVLRFSEGQANSNQRYL